MKSSTKSVLAILFLVAMAGCATSASPPSGIERALYHVTTNFVTNINPSVIIGPSNNIVATNWFTNIFATYDLQPRESVITGIQTGGTIATTFGFGAGGIIASILLGAYGAWSTWRSKRKGDLNTVFAQNIETAREVIRNVGGDILGSNFKEQIKAQQVDGGVKLMASDVVESTVNTVDAKESAKKVIKSANGL